MDERYLIQLEDRYSDEISYIGKHYNMIKVTNIFLATTIVLDDLTDLPLKRIILENKYWLLPIKHVDFDRRHHFIARKYQRERYPGQYYLDVWKTEGRITNINDHALEDTEQFYIFTNNGYVCLDNSSVKIVDNIGFATVFNIDDFNNQCLLNYMNDNKYILVPKRYS